MIGVIRLSGIKVFAHHGVLPEEHAIGQEFVVDVAVELDIERAAHDDDLASTMDYGILAESIHRRVARERWNLIERVADRVVDLVFEDERVRAVEVTVHKPRAPIPVEFDDVSVTLRRSR
jgi:7,8-dihydroneopterin aldolase/epimerase/oxygenase